MNRIERERKASGLTQVELADLLCVSTGTVANWEKGYTEPGAKALCDMRDTFGCSIDYLLGGTDERSI